MRLFFLLAVAVALPACSRRAELDGALAETPVYAPTTLERATSAHTSDTIHDLLKFHSITWYLSTADGWEDVDAFYRAQPGWVRDDGDDPDDGPPRPEDTADEVPGQVVFHQVPEGWKEGEGVWVTVEKARTDGRTQLWISEDVLSSRR